MQMKQMDTIELADQTFDQLKTWRRHLHQHPELSFQEFETAKYVSSILESIGNLKVERKIGKNGIVATLSSGEGPTIAIRADMDALPIQEENNHNFQSKNPGVMHACGHDAHTAMLLGAVHILAKKFEAGELLGTVKFIFQPAEEDTDEHGLSGAPYMIRDGALDGVDAAIALHVCPWQPVGTIQMNNGYSMANVDVFEATIKGTGGHGGYPHLSTDPVWMLGAVLQAFYGVVGRKVSPLETAAASIGQIETGSASNVIPSEVRIKGTMRTYSAEMREKLATEVEQVFQIAESMGGSYEFKVEKGEPALNNDSKINQMFEQTTKSLYPDMKIHWEPFGMGGEDFGWMTQKVPGAMVFLGCSLEDGINRDLHTPIFDIDEKCLPQGAAILAETAISLLNKWKAT